MPVDLPSRKVVSFPFSLTWTTRHFSTLQSTKHVLATSLISTQTPINTNVSVHANITEDRDVFLFVFCFVGFLIESRRMAWVNLKKHRQQTFYLLRVDSPSFVRHVCVCVCEFLSNYTLHTSYTFLPCFHRSSTATIYRFCHSTHFLRSMRQRRLEKITNKNTRYGIRFDVCVSVYWFGGNNEERLYFEQRTLKIGRDSQDTRRRIQWEWIFEQFLLAADKRPHSWIAALLIRGYWPYDNDVRKIVAHSLRGSY